MTGYAQARGEENGWALRVSLRSVNHRFLDLHLRLPEGCEVFEPQIRQRLRERVRRGHVDVTVQLEAAGAAAVSINREVATAYLEAARALQQQFGMKAEPDLAALLRLPGVVAPPSVAGEEDQALLGALLVKCLDEALARLEQMRESEGSHLAEEMAGRLASIREHSARIAALAEQARPAYARRLETRLKELLGETPLDAARVAQEAALVAERGDITEEVTRMGSHVEQFEKLLRGAGEVGKKLDFLLQEMQREANTMLSKTPGVEAEGLGITGLALEVKAEVEKLREQAQNVE